MKLTDAERESLEVAARSTNLWVSDLQVNAIAAVVERIIAARVTAALNEAAEAIEALQSDPDRRRPLAPDAEFATDLANDIEWAALIVRGLIPTDSAIAGAP